MTGPGGAAAVPAQTEKRAEETPQRHYRDDGGTRSVHAGGVDQCEICGLAGIRKRAAAGDRLTAADIGVLMIELERTEGDLWVARQVATERGDALDNANAALAAAHLALDDLNEDLLRRRDDNMEAERVRGANLALYNGGTRIALEDSARSVRRIRDDLNRAIARVGAATGTKGDPTSE